MIKLKALSNYLEEIAPLQHKESYDNAGLLVGDFERQIENVLITLDVTEAVVAEAIDKKCQLIVAHHPIIFKGLKQLTGSNYVERTVLKAIKNDIAIYASHTNLDHANEGVNKKIADQLNLQGQRILAPSKNTLCKLTAFAPIAVAESIKTALGAAGAGHIGHYKNCSFESRGTGAFEADEAATPHIGSHGKLEKVTESRIEVLLPHHLQNSVLKALKKAHPYEEVAYYLSDLNNTNQDVGAGRIGELPEALAPEAFLAYLKEKMQLQVIRHTAFGKDIKKVAICGGAGSFLLKTAIHAGADAFVTADFKYHEFFDAEDRLIIADIGHYESEVFTKALFYELLSKKFTNIALYLSEVVTNPICYF